MTHPVLLYRLTSVMDKKTAQQLSNLDIDEISLVDRPANQHGLVTITKRQENLVGIYDSEGVELSEDELEAGDVVFDDDGQQYLVEETNEVAEEPELVGKAVNFGSFGSGAKKLGNMADRNRKGLVAGGAAGFVGGRMSKSYSDTVLEELSKAYTTGDRDEVIAKALGRIEESDQRAQRAENIAKALADEAEYGEFFEVAKNFDALPVETDELATILQTVSKVLDEDQLNTLGRVLAAADNSIYASEGYDGAGDSSVYGLVESAAAEAVGKGLSLSQEEAVVALFAENPDAYEEYLSEIKY